MHDYVEPHVRSLKSVVFTSDNYGSLLASALMKKLAQELKLIITRKQEENWNLDGILGEIEKEIEARERARLRNTNQINRKKEPHMNIPLLKLLSGAVN